MLDVLLDALLDTAKLLPFLFITYLILEFVEHKAAEKTRAAAAKAGALGPGSRRTARHCSSVRFFPPPPPTYMRAA